jgi:hypothetical protein
MMIITKMNLNLSQFVLFKFKELSVYWASYLDRSNFRYLFLV